MQHAVMVHLTVIVFLIAWMDTGIIMVVVNKFNLRFPDCLTVRTMQNKICTQNL